MHCASPTRSYLSLLGVFVLLLGCAPGKPASLTVQLCLSNDQGVADFMGMMRSIASKENMTFVDNSAETQDDFKAEGAKFEKLGTPGSVKNFGLKRGDRTFMMGGNLGLPTYQVALGFFGDPTIPDARRLADAVVKRIRTHWPVETISAGAAARPMKACPGKI